MTIVTSYDWESNTWTNHNGDNPARQAWREAVAEIAEKAKTSLPECNGRVDSAVKIVLAGDVELLQDGTAKVASQSNGTTVYHVVNGECDCKDYPRAPQNFCKHRLAFGIHKRAYTLAKQRLEQLDHTSNGTDQPQVEPEKPIVPTAEPVVQSEPTVSPVTLPEAPASVNCHITLAGRQVQVTLRDSDEQRLLARLETLLERFPVTEDHTQQAQQEPREGWCSKHNAQMKRKTNEKGSWWFHKTPEGWCHGK